MDSDYEKQLEAEIDRELKGLPDLSAPLTLTPRVMHAIAARTAARRSRPSWSSWPLALQTASLAGLVALFAALCFAASALAQSGPGVDLSERCSQWYSGLAVIWRGLNAVLGLLGTALQHIDTRLLLAGGAAVLLAYSLCVALAAGSFRLALARTRNHLL